jgi:hypothetical protein
MTFSECARLAAVEPQADIERGDRQQRRCGGIADSLVADLGKADEFTQRAVEPAVVVAKPVRRCLPGGDVGFGRLADGWDRYWQRRRPRSAVGPVTSRLPCRGRVGHGRHEADAVVDPIEQVRLGAARDVEVEIRRPAAAWSDGGPKQAGRTGTRHVREPDPVHLARRQARHLCRRREAVAGPVDPPADDAARNVDEVRAAVAVEVVEEKLLWADVGGQGR